jgi:hypothetical protein
MMTKSRQKERAVLVRLDKNSLGQFVHLFQWQHLHIQSLKIGTWYVLRYSRYYNNLFQFLNFGYEDVVIEKGERIGQGIFKPFLLADDDQVEAERTGGLLICCLF